MKRCDLKLKIEYIFTEIKIRSHNKTYFLNDVVFEMFICMFICMRNMQYIH